MTVPDIKTLLEPIQNRLNAATPIELEVAGTEPSMSGQHFSIRRKGIPGLRITGHEYGHGGVYTDLLVHAPTDQARLLAAVQAAIELHKPERGTVHDPDDGETKEMDYCETCSDSQWLDEATAVAYPCPTVAAIESALTEAS